MENQKGQFKAVDKDPIRKKKKKKKKFELSVMHVGKIIQ
jgi:hypothetical protein